MSRGGALLLHGFTGTPWEVAPLGDSLRHEGLVVEAPVLSGHCQTPERLAETRWADWYESAEAALFRLAARTDRLVVVGSSMGGMLALLLARRHPRLVRAVCTVGTPLAYPVWVRALVEVLATIAPAGALRKRGGSDVRAAAARAANPTYDRLPFRGLRELFALIRVASREVRDLEAPVLIVHGLADHTAPYRSSLALLRLLLRAEVRHLTLTQSYHLAIVDVERALVVGRVGAFVRRHVGAPDEVKLRRTG
jgi:carboxylesterase